MRRRGLAAALLLLWASEGLGAPAPSAKGPAAAAPKPDARALAAGEAARKGVAFLLSTQSKDGSWGSHDPVAWSAEMAFALVSPSAHDAVRNACTALSARALLAHRSRIAPGGAESGPAAALDGAIRKATDYLLKSWKVGYSPGLAFSSWAYTYTLEYLCDLAASDLGGAYRKRIEEVAPQVAKALALMQTSDGGWGYYCGPRGMGGATAFTTASAALALDRARGAGFGAQGPVTSDAAKLTLRMRSPDGSFVYSADHIDRGGSMVRVLGAACRTLVCNLSLVEGRHALGEKDLKEGLDLLLRTAPYLECGRKRIIPHRDAPHDISGYFFFYGYHYAAETLALLPKGDRARYWDHIVPTILRTQEKSGSWWDALLYDYGDKWGTAFAVLTLERYLRG